MSCHVMYVRTYVRMYRYRYVSVCIGMYRYVSVCIGMYRYVCMYVCLTFICLISINWTTSVDWTVPVVSACGAAD